MLNDLSDQRCFLIFCFVFAAGVIFFFMFFNGTLSVAAAAVIGQDLRFAANLGMRDQGSLYNAFAIAAEIEDIDANLSQEDVKGHNLHPNPDP